MAENASNSVFYVGKIDSLWIPNTMEMEEECRVCRKTSPRITQLTRRATGEIQFVCAPKTPIKIAIQVRNKTILRDSLSRLEKLMIPEQSCREQFEEERAEPIPFPYQISLFHRLATLFDSSFCRNGIPNTSSRPDEETVLNPHTKVMWANETFIRQHIGVLRHALAEELQEKFE